MRKINIAILLLFVNLFLISCGGGISKQEATAAGFSVIERQIKEKFGNEAYYTNLSIIYDETLGNSITATVAKNPESLQMEEWLQSQDNWNQTSDVTIEIPEGTKATDFMFQLNETINLKKLGELVEKSKAQLAKEKNIEDSKLHIAFINFPANGAIAKANYGVNLEPKNGGTTFRFSYTLDGELIKMDY